MGNYTYSFSTGEVIDTMEVSGYVAYLAIKRRMFSAPPDTSANYNGILTQLFSRCNTLRGLVKKL